MKSLRCWIKVKVEVNLKSINLASSYSQTNEAEYVEIRGKIMEEYSAENVIAELSNVDKSIQNTVEETETVFKVQREGMSDYKNNTVQDISSERSLDVVIVNNQPKRNVNVYLGPEMYKTAQAKNIKFPYEKDESPFKSNQNAGALKKVTNYIDSNSQFRSKYT
jgi:hypothetical protein